LNATTDRFDNQECRYSWEFRIGNCISTVEKHFPLLLKTQQSQKIYFHNVICAQITFFAKSTFWHNVKEHFPIAPTNSNFRATDEKLLVKTHVFSKDTTRFNNFILKKLDNHNNMKKAYTFLGQNASFKGSSTQFQDKYSENTRKIHFYTFSNHSISHKWPIFLRKLFFASPEKLCV
jgi:hypothetical protein